MSGDPHEQVGPYTVYEQLGSGGMATVHRAEHRAPDGSRQVVALKRLHPGVAADPDLLRAFHHEARLAGFLRHANVAHMFEFGRANGSYYIAMEFVPGPTLAQLMRQCAYAAGPLPLAIALEVLIQICEALDYAHHLRDESGAPLGLIHRDVSPSNVIVSNTGIVKLIDFGVAKAKDSGVQTKAGTIKGKFGYLAPESMRGRADARADLFSVGVLAHELLTGRPLFLGKNDFDTLHRIREMPVPKPSRWNPHVTPDLEDIVLTALQRDPTVRWQSAAALRTALRNVARERGDALAPRQIVNWIQWAFSQRPRSETTELRRTLEALDEPSVVIEVRERASAIDLRAAPAPLPTTVPGLVMPVAVPAKRDSDLSVRRTFKRLGGRRGEPLPPPRTLDELATTTPPPWAKTPAGLVVSAPREAVASAPPEAAGTPSGHFLDRPSTGIELVPPAKPRRLWWLWVALLLVVVAGGGAAAVYLFGVRIEL